MAHDEQLKDVPGGAEFWRGADGRVFLAYLIPNPFDPAAPPTPLLYHVPDLEELAAILGPAGKLTLTRDGLTDEQLRGAGAHIEGKTTELADKSEHPLEFLTDDFEQEAQIRPWLRDPEMLRIHVAAKLGGRTVTDAELKTTEWWRSRTPEEREWASFVASEGPGTVERALNENRVIVRDALMKAGMEQPTEQFVGYLADRFTTGQITERQLQDDLRRETDPRAPGASPFAGRDLPAGSEIVRYGGQVYARIDGVDHLINGPGQAAKYGAGQAVAAEPGQQAGTLKDYFAMQAPAAPQDLGEEDRVRALLLQWLGPRVGKWTDEQIADEAAKLRQNPNAEDDFIRRLQGIRQAWIVPGNTNPNLKYEDVAPAVRALWQDEWGETPDETDGAFVNLVNMNDLYGAQDWLRTEGLARGVEAVTNRFVTQAMQGSGGTVRRTVRS